MIIISITLILTNVEKTFTNTTNLIIALVVFIIMSISAVGLILADKKSRFSGQGSTAYFASPMYFFEALMPPVVLLVLGLINDDFGLIASSLGGCALGILPFVCATPIKRISDYYEISGLVFGLVAALIVFAGA